MDQVSSETQRRKEVDKAVPTVDGWPRDSDVARSENVRVNIL